MMWASASLARENASAPKLKELRVPHELYPSWRGRSINDLRVGSDAPDGCLRCRDEAFAEMRLDDRSDNSREHHQT